MEILVGALLLTIAFLIGFAFWLASRADARLRQLLELHKDVLVRGEARERDLLNRVMARDLTEYATMRRYGDMVTSPMPQAMTDEEEAQYHAQQRRAQGG